MAYGKISKNNELIYAPRNLLRADGELITGFSTNVELMKQYGYKEVIEYPIDYDKNLEITYISKLEEDSAHIYVYYDKKLKDTYGTSTDIDPYNYYTKNQTYSRENIDYMINNLKEYIKELELSDSDLRGMISDKISISEISDIKGELGGFKITYDKLMEELDGKLAVQSSEFQQTFDGFKTMVEKTYAKKEDIGSSITNVDGYTIMLTKEAIITTCDKDGNINE